MNVGELLLYGYLRIKDKLMLKPIYSPYHVANISENLLETDTIDLRSVYLRPTQIPTNAQSLHVSCSLYAE